jgi:Thiol:disulfide interchange protein
MNQHKKIWFSVFILIFMFSLYSVTALATEITPEQVEQILNQQSSQAPSQSVASTVSSKPAVSSRRSVTSKKPVSSEIFSGASGDASGDVSGDVSGGVFSSGEESSEIVLPSVDSIEENNPLSSVIVDSAANKKMNWIGILSWVCIALGIVVVLIVVFSNRRPPRGGGRKRYRRPNRPHKKRLLNDKYYRNLKY